MRAQGKVSISSNYHASSFRILKSSTKIPSPPLTLFIVMLSKAHLTSHSRMSGSRWKKHKLGRNINNLRYADDTTFMAESEEELKSLLMKVKEEREKAGLKLNI